MTLRFLRDPYPENMIRFLTLLTNVISQKSTPSGLNQKNRQTYNKAILLQFILFANCASAKSYLNDSIYFLRQTFYQQTINLINFGNSALRAAKDLGKFERIDMEYPNVKEPKDAMKMIFEGGFFSILAQEVFRGMTIPLIHKENFLGLLLGLSCNEKYVTRCCLARLMADEFDHHFIRGVIGIISRDLTAEKQIDMVCNFLHVNTRHLINLMQVQDADNS